MKKLFTSALFWFLGALVVIAFFKAQIVQAFVTGASYFGGHFRLFLTAIAGAIILLFYIITFFSGYLFLRIGLPEQMAFFGKSLLITGLVIGIIFGFNYIVISGIILGFLSGMWVQRQQ